MENLNEFKQRLSTIIDCIDDLLNEIPMLTDMVEKLSKEDVDNINNDNGEDFDNIIINIGRILTFGNDYQKEFIELNDKLSEKGINKWY